MEDPTDQDLQKQLATLAAEKAELESRLAEEKALNAASSSGAGGGAERGASGGGGGENGPAASASWKKRGWGWTLLATVLIVIGALLAPVAVVSTWAQRELTDTSYFVNTFAPLAKKPAVQNFVADKTVSAIESKVDINKIADDVFNGLDTLNLPPAAKSALGLLKAPAVNGVKSLINNTVTKFVQSDAFATIWKDTLTITHKQLVATATGQKNAAVSVGQNGEIGLQLGPIITAVKKQLVAQGLTLAKNIPAVSQTIVIAQSSSVGLYVALYNIVVAVGIWLPWVALIILAAGVLVARRRALALAWASAALLISMVLVGIGINVGKTIFVLSVSSSIPKDAATTLYSGILGFVTSIVVVVAVLAATVLVVTLLAGPWRWARSLRGYGGAGFAAARRGAEKHGITTGATGVWLYHQRVLLRIIVGAACAALILFVRPLTPALIVWTAVIGVVVIAVLELLSRPPVTADAAEPAEPALAAA